MTIVCKTIAFITIPIILGIQVLCYLPLRSQDRKYTWRFNLLLNVVWPSTPYQRERQNSEDPHWQKCSLSQLSILAFSTRSSLSLNIHSTLNLEHSDLFLRDTVFHMLSSISFLPLCFSVNLQLILLPLRGLHHFLICSNSLCYFFRNVMNSFF